MNHVVGRRWRLVAAVASLLGLAGLAVVTSPAGASPAGTATWGAGRDLSHRVLGRCVERRRPDGRLVGGRDGWWPATGRSAWSSPAPPTRPSPVRSRRSAASRACRPPRPVRQPGRGGRGRRHRPRAAAPSASEPLAGLQWDMRQINASLAHEITSGSPDVVVSDIDTRLDFTHPISRRTTTPPGAPTARAARRSRCSLGNDQNGHGTAGTVAAAGQRHRPVGRRARRVDCGDQVEQRRRLLLPRDGHLLVHVGTEAGIDVTNNSLRRSVAVQLPQRRRAACDLDRRAARHPLRDVAGVVVVASEGNESTDLSHPEVDVISPDFRPATRWNADHQRLLGRPDRDRASSASATGDLSLKSFYSSYGISTADVAAPGGDSILQVTPEATNGRVLSTYRTGRGVRPVVDGRGATYCYLQGTSMAGPHVAGVAALIRSQHADLSAGPMPPGWSRRPTRCPALTPRSTRTSRRTAANRSRAGAERPHNSFYGSGEMSRAGGRVR